MFHSYERLGSFVIFSLASVDFLFVSGSCDFVDRFLAEKTERSTKSHERTRK